MSGPPSRSLLEVTTPERATRRRPSFITIQCPPFARASVPTMADDDDWVGTPPEGRHSRDRADPGFWRNQWQPAAAGSVLFVLVVIVLLLALL
jgi:hypothetical protein